MIWDHSLIEIQFENLDSVTLKGGREALLLCLIECTTKNCHLAS